jgi:hypothetical protein
MARPAPKKDDASIPFREAVSRAIRTIHGTQFEEQTILDLRGVAHVFLPDVVSNLFLVDHTIHCQPFPDYLKLFGRPGQLSRVLARLENRRLPPPESDTVPVKRSEQRTSG